MEIIVFNDVKGKEKTYQIGSATIDTSTGLYTKYSEININPLIYPSYEMAKKDCNKFNYNYNPTKIFFVIEVPTDSINFNFCDAF